jgi:hypothetical protein
MRRSYISPEFVKNKVYGTFNMLEESNFFSGKMLEIEDKISIINEDIIWYQKLNGEQLDFNIESSLNSNVYSSSLSKQKNHILRLDDKQSKSQMNSNSKWILEVSLKEILSDYIFSNLKRWRTFEGLKSEYTLERDVDVAIISYISENVLNRYKFSKIELFIDYKDLRLQNSIKWNNNWNNDITLDKIWNKLERNTKFDDSSVSVIFEQQKSSSDFNFDYFYNIFFEKI